MRCKYCSTLERAELLIDGHCLACWSEINRPPDPNAPIDWIGVYWHEVEEGQKVWVKRVTNRFVVNGPFKVVSREGRRLQNKATSFSHYREELVVPRKFLRTPMSLRHLS